MEFTVEQIAGMLGGEIIGNPKCKVWKFCKIEEGEEGALSFLANAKYTEYVYTTKSSVVLVSRTTELHSEVPCTLIRVDDPYSAIAQVMRMVDQLMTPKKSGIHPTAIVSRSAKVGERVYIGAYSVIEDGAVISDGAEIYPQCYVGEGVTIGKDTKLYAGVKIYKGCKIGDKCILHSGCVIGSDGFGFAPDDSGRYSKIPQLGIVIIENDVEIGANTTIDRSTMGATLIHRGVKLDNLVHIAHNVDVGEDTVMAAMTGIAGSTKIGKHCMFGGQSGCVGHLKIDDNNTFAARCGVANDIKGEGGVYHFHPHIEAHKFRRSFVGIKQLPETMSIVSNLEKSLRQATKKIEELESKLASLESRTTEQ